MDGRGIPKGARVAGGAGAVGDVQVGVAQVPHDDQQVRLVLSHVGEGGGGVVGEPQVADDGDFLGKAGTAWRRQRAEPVLGAQGVQCRVPAPVVVLLAARQSCPGARPSI